MLKENNNGITLVALVVTIIVLLILAGIAINLTVGNNGLFKRAGNATNEYKKASTNEQLTMNEALDEIDKIDKKEEIKEYTIKYDANGGTGIPEEQIAKSNSNVDINFEIIPKKKGYSFQGWSKANDAIVAEFTEDGNKTILVKENVTLYAVWKEVETVYLYNKGIINDLAGDFILKYTSTQYSHGGFSKNSNNLRVTKNTSSSQYTTTGFLSQNKIDITLYKTLTFTYDTTSYIKQSDSSSYIDNSLYWDMGLSNGNVSGLYYVSFMNKYNRVFAPKTQGSKTNLDEPYYDVDLSDIEGEYYIGGCAVGAYWPTEVHDIYVTSIYLH